MNYEIHKVYNEIIREVSRQMTDEDINLTESQIREIRHDWQSLLEEMTNDYNYYQEPSESNSDEVDSDEKLEAQNPNYMMCLYSRVHKHKYKWKVTLHQGFMNVGKREFAFATATGDLTWG